MKLILIFLLLLVAELAYFGIANRFNIIDKPNNRSSHTRVTLRGGGIIFLIGVLLFQCFYGPQYLLFTGGLVLISGISFVDDIRPLSSNLRLLVQFTAMLLMFYEWGLFGTFPIWYVIPAFIFCTGIINAYNFMDGINGITGGYSLVTLTTLAYINYAVTPFVDPQLLYVTIAAAMVFCFFNFRKKARCFAGDVGSVGIAFVILFALGKLILLTSDFSYILLLAVYGADSVLTIVHRIKLGEKLTEPHRKHAYQLLANEIGFPHVSVSALYMSLQMVINTGLLSLGHFTYLFCAVVLLVLTLAYIVFIRSCYHLHVQK
ncbi:MAG: MraY family glycosyltransferase [Tannerellaceae bacterium]